jgi:hypothetical protein
MLSSRQRVALRPFLAFAGRTLARFTLLRRSTVGLKHALAVI